MQSRYQPLSDGGVRLELTPTTNSPLAIDVTESTEMRIRRLISENPVVIFTRSACCMCHVMKRLLLSAVSVHPIVIELEEDEIAALPCSAAAAEYGGGYGPPEMFIGGTHVGGLESLVALHLSGRLVPKLVEVGAITDHMVL
uniref:Glutaredoxin-C6-like n=1 Tax=Nicotiana tabacum TaxID=4097 RepID=A0A1S4CK72_TOBAC|nr:glutaredoxin-C6-like [Nicotiana tomentosiformis]XP_016501314.1 PREDICTED: glutaredoxin-C6-like [Nicotiana tabacum]